MRPTVFLPKKGQKKTSKKGLRFVGTWMRQVFQNRNLLGHIATFTTPIDLLSLSFCSSQTKDHCEQVQSKRPISNQIVDALQTRVFEGNKETTRAFCQALQKSRAWISGSFPLQVVLGQQWDKSDLDIFVASNLYRGQATPIEDFCWQHCRQDDSKYQYDNYIDRFKAGLIDRVRTYQFPTMLVQVVLVNGPKITAVETTPPGKRRRTQGPVFSSHPLIQWIDTSFDFNFLKIVSDGGSKLEILNSWSVVSKTDETEHPGRSRHHFLLFEARRLKYLNRGFTVPRSICIKDQVFAICESCVCYIENDVKKAIRFLQEQGIRFSNSSRDCCKHCSGWWIHKQVPVFPV